MNYKETLLFIGKCLTISHDKNNLKIVKNTIEKDLVDWDSIVKVSTKHYVFPALYCNLKRTELLSLLPKDLVSYMKDITDLNRKRNQQIIEQADEINSLLLNNGITPIFLKGTGFLLQDFYEDIAERMVGDIDFLVAKHDFNEAIKILENQGYSYVSNKYHFPSAKHHPKIQKESQIAAVEVHHEMTIGKYQKEFNYESIIKNCRVINGYSTLSYEDQLCLSIIAKQINDNGQYYKTMSLRNAYDVFLLSQKTYSLKNLKNYKTLFTPLNNFLAITHLVFDSKKIHFENNTSSKKYLEEYKKLIENESYRKRHIKKWRKKLFVRKRIGLIFKSFFYKDYRYWFIKRITNPTWYREKMIQLGIKSNS